MRGRIGGYDLSYRRTWHLAVAKTIRFAHVEKEKGFEFTQGWLKFACDKDYGCDD